MQKGLRLKAAGSKKKPNSDDTDIATGAVKPKIHPHVGARFPRFSSQGHGPMGRRAPQAKAKTPCAPKTRRAKEAVHHDSSGSFQKPSFPPLQAAVENICVRLTEPASDGRDEGNREDVGTCATSSSTTSSIAWVDPTSNLEWAGADDDDDQYLEHFQMS